MAEAIKVLVAEDNEINRMVLAGFLSQLDCAIDMVENGIEAVAAITVGDYDIVLMDIHMPEMDGITAVGRIRSLPEPKASIPVIAVTADISERNRENCLSAGMNDFIAKPINRVLLFKTVSQFTGVPVPDSLPVSRPEAGHADLKVAPDKEATEEINTIIGNLDDLTNRKLC